MGQVFVHGRYPLKNMGKYSYTDEYTLCKTWASIRVDEYPLQNMGQAVVHGRVIPFLKRGANTHLVTYGAATHSLYVDENTSSCLSSSLDSAGNNIRHKSKSALQRYKKYIPGTWKYFLTHMMFSHFFFVF